MKTHYSHYFQIVMLVSVLDSEHILAQAPPDTNYKIEEPQFTSVRRTHKTLYGVKLQRIRLLWSEVSKKKALEAQAKQIAKYPESILLRSVTEFKYSRNCHDYTWASFMSCCPGGTGLEQREAWWMGWYSDPTTMPNMNWADGSMLYEGKPVGQKNEKGEYICDTSALDALKTVYTDNESKMIPLPVSPKPAGNWVYPAHSALLVKYETNPKIPEGKSIGWYQSKWGAGGLWKHRWGEPFCPSIYCETPTVQLFVPSWAGPYSVNLSPWD